MIYRLRVLLDASVDCFRDIEIEDSATLEEFHNVIVQAFQLPGDEMASFYASDEEWNQGEEYCLFDMTGGMSAVKKMADTPMEKAMNKTKTRMIYIYDFLSLWTFSVELADVVSTTAGTAYPQVIFAVGELPDNAPDKEFEADPRFHDDGEEEYRGDIDDGDDEFYDDESFDENDFY